MSFTLTPIDWCVLAAYLLATFGIAFYVRVGQRTASDFFLAGRSMHWIVVSLSLYATLFSTISFVGVPGEAYKNGVLTWLKSLGYALFTPLAVWLFLRFFYTSSETFTAYQYLERRFDGVTRTLGSLVFLVARALYGAAVFYAAAQVFHRMTGWAPEAAIVAIGLFAVAYTSIGGMRAVMITDVVQTVIIVAGLLAVFWKASSLIDFDYSGLWNFTIEHEHGFSRIASAEFYSCDPYQRYTFWVLLLMAVMMPMQHYGTDQLVVQRLLASKSYEQARRAIYLKTAFTPVLMAMFFGVGLLLFYYYGSFAALPEAVTVDQVMAHFIVTELPSPLPGLIAAALMAALMSTVDSTVGSLATVTCVDLLGRCGILGNDQSRQILYGRVLTLLWGVVIVVAALMLTWASKGRRAIVFELISVWGALWSVLLVVMLCGVLTRWATPRAASCGLACGMVVNLVLPWYLYLGTAPEHRISPFWVPVPGALVTLAIVVAISLLYPNPGDSR